MQQAKDSDPFASSSSICRCPGWTARRRRGGSTWTRPSERFRSSFYPRRARSGRRLSDAGVRGVGDEAGPPVAAPERSRRRLRVAGGREPAGRGVIRAAPGPAPRGMRVLVAEDNAVNQKVALRMLERLGLPGRGRRGNGAEAVAAIAQDPLPRDPDGLPHARDGRLRGDRRGPPRARRAAGTRRSSR